MKAAREEISGQPFSCHNPGLQFLHPGFRQGMSRTHIRNRSTGPDDPDSFG
jgi:hypothetical protein